MFENKETILDFNMRQQFTAKTFELAEPIYSKMRAGWPEMFDTMATYEQDTLVLSVNGYSRFVEYLTTAFRDIGVIVSMIVNYRSALLINFGPNILNEIERDIFCDELKTAGLRGQKGLLQLTSTTNPTLSSDMSDTLRPHDILACYLFLYNAKFFVYNMDVKLRPDEDKK